MRDQRTTLKLSASARAKWTTSSSKQRVLKAGAIALDTARHEAEVAGNPDHPIARTAHGQTAILLPAGHKGRFVRDFMAESQSIEGAVKAYVAAVKDGTYPGPEHSY